MKNSRLSSLFLIVALALVYLVTARLGLLLALPPDGKATAIWLPSGISLAAMALLGSRMAVGVWLGAFAANILDALGPGNGHSLAANLQLSTAIACGSTAQALAGSWLLSRWIGTPRPFESGRDAFRFVGLAALMCTVSCSVGVFSLFVVGFASRDQLAFSWFTWWLGDATGVLTIGSFLLIWSQPPALTKRPVEATLLTGMFFACGMLLFGLLAPFWQLPAPLAYPIVPLLLWATFRFGQHGGVAALCLTGWLAVWATAEARGPFVQPTLAASLMLLQMFNGVIAVTVLVVSAVLRQERNSRLRERQSAADLAELNSSLERRVAERTAEMERAERRFRAIFHSQFQFIGLMSPSGKLLEANRTALAAAGVEGRDVLGKPFWETAWWTHDLPQQERLKQGIAQACQGEKVRFEASHPTPEGSLVWVDFSLSPFYDEQGQVIYLIPEGRDISDRKRAEELLVNSLREKDVLLREVHHRVKNNLQIISALLDLQSSHTQDPLALVMFQESRARVRSMALIHERLYSSQDLSRVSFEEYARQLIQDLLEAYQFSEEKMEVQVEVRLPSLPLDLAIPCGLLLNELVSNCLKHAFPEHRNGRLEIVLRPDGEHILLAVKDDGVGFPSGFDLAKSQSFGMELVHTLVEQLKGQIEISPPPGSRIEIRFPTPQ